MLGGTRKSLSRSDSDPAARVLWKVGISKRTLYLSLSLAPRGATYLATSASAKPHRMVCPDQYPLFLTLARGECTWAKLALKWGDISFGAKTAGGNRIIYVRRNWVDSWKAK